MSKSQLPPVNDLIIDRIKSYAARHQIGLELCVAVALDQTLDRWESDDREKMLAGSDQQ